MMLPRILVTLLMLFGLLSCRARDDYQSSSIKEAADSIRPLTLRTERHAICGVDRWQERRHRLCGIELHKLRRSESCGAELYNKRADMSCPGSLSEDVYRERTSADCRNTTNPPSCRPGYRQTAYVENKQTCGRADYDYEVVNEKIRTCSRPQTIKSCRKKAFGVETWKSCRHSDHGPESYRSCRREEFGIDRHNQCSFYLTAEETRQFARQTSELLPFMGETLVTARGHYFAYANDEQSMACHIAKFTAEPLFDAMTNELKVMYLTKFGRTWNNTNFACQHVQEPLIESETCDLEDQSNKCRAVRSYRGAKKWISTKSNDLTKLAGDISAERDAALKRELQNLLLSIDSYTN